MLTPIQRAIALSVFRRDLTGASTAAPAGRRQRRRSSDGSHEDRNAYWSDAQIGHRSATWSSSQSRHRRATRSCMIRASHGFAAHVGLNV